MQTSKRYNFLRNNTPKPMAGAEAVCSGAVMTAIDTDAKLMVCITTSGRAPALVSKYRPPVPVMVVTPDVQLVRHCRYANAGHTRREWSRLISINEALFRNLFTHFTVLYIC